MNINHQHCAYKTCFRQAKSVKWCHSHYAQWKRGMELTPLKDDGIYKELPPVSVGPDASKEEKIAAFLMDVENKIASLHL